MEQQNAAANGGQVAAPETEDNMEKDASPQEAAAAQQGMEEMPFEQAHRQEEDSERTTKAFSQRLKREKEKYDKEYEPYRELFEEMRAMGVSAQSPGELLELLRAQNGQHQWIEQQREAENARQMLREAIETDPSYLAAKEMAYEKMYADDLAAIKEVFPEVTASHVSELGKVYLSLMGALRAGQAAGSKPAFPIPAMQTGANIDFSKYPNFKIEEFACRGGWCCDGSLYLLNEAIVAVAQRIRSHFGRPLIITKVGGVRCQALNRVTYGAIANSKHTQGKAIDFYVQGVGVGSVLAYCRELQKQGIISYCYTNNTNMRGAVHAEIA